MINPRQSLQEPTSWQSFVQPLLIPLLLGLVLIAAAAVVIISLIPLYLSPKDLIYNPRTENFVSCKLNDRKIRMTSGLRRSKEVRSQKTQIECPIVILGAGAAGSHTAYRLASKYPQQICIFERNNRVGGRALDLDFNGNLPEAYSNVPVSPLGSIRFYHGQAVMRELANELGISYTQFDSEKPLIKERGRILPTFDAICAAAYLNLTCTTYSNGSDSQDLLWERLLAAYRANPSALFRFGDFQAFSRAVLGDEANNFLRDTYRFRSFFLDINAHGLMEHMDQDFALKSGIYYPNHGMSQFPKRMMYQATLGNQSQLFLNEEVLRIDENPDGSCYPFTIETSRYLVQTHQLVLAMDPSGWENITGSVARDIKADEHFQMIYPVRVVVVQAYWSHRWWEETKLYPTDIYRILTRQNCLSTPEIFSTRPDQREQNLTRIVYDDGVCVDFWIDLIARSSEDDLIDEILRGIRSIYTDVTIERPKKIFVQVWPGAWHLQHGNSPFSNKEISRWALNPLPRFNRSQLSLIGEAFFLDRALWTEGAIKSSLLTLVSQFGYQVKCFENDVPTRGTFCPADFV